MRDEISAAGDMHNNYTRVIAEKPDATQKIASEEGHWISFGKSI